MRALAWWGIVGQIFNRSRHTAKALTKPASLKGNTGRVDLFHSQCAGKAGDRFACINLRLAARADHPTYSRKNRI
jgi:hypothetical protein